MLIPLSDVNVTDAGSNYTIGTYKGDLFTGDGALVTSFDGVSNAIKLVCEKFPTPKQEESSSDRGEDWIGTSSWESCIDLFLNKPESLVVYDPTELRPKDPNERGLELQYDVTGDFIDVGRVLEGLPESFGSLHNGNARSRRVRMVVSTSESSGGSTGEILTKSQRTMRLVDALESNGVRVELLATEQTTCGTMDVTVKRFDEQIVLSDLAVVFHPSWLRRIVFRVNEWSDTWQYGYGDSRQTMRNFDRMLSGYNDELTVCIGNNFHSEDVCHKLFDELEQKLAAELDLFVPTLSSIIVEGGQLRTVEL